MVVLRGPIALTNRGDDGEPLLRRVPAALTEAKLAIARALAADVAAIRTVANGGTLIAPSVARKVVSEFARLKPAPKASTESLPDPLSELLILNVPPLPSTNILQ